MTNKTEEVGFAISVRDFLVHVDGLPTVRINDMVEAENGARGWVNSLSATSAEILMVDEVKVEPGQTFKRLPNRLGIPVG